MSRKTNALNSYESALDGGITDTAPTLLVVANPQPLADPAYLTLEPDDPLLRELIRVDAISGTSFSSITRGLVGSASGGQAHLSGAIIRSTPVHQQLDDLFDDIEDLEATEHAELHAAASHSDQTATGAELETLTDGSETALHTHDHGAINGLSDDDHAEYLKDKANGGVAGEVPTHDHSGAGEAGTVDHGDTTGKGDDDHTQYLNVARHDSDDHSGLEEFYFFAPVYGELAIGSLEFEWFLPFGIDIIDFHTTVGTAPTGSSVIVDVHATGVTIFTTPTNRPNIIAGNKIGTGVPDITSISAGSTLIAFIDNIGTTEPGQDLQIMMSYTRQ